VRALVDGGGFAAAVEEDADGKEDAGVEGVMGASYGAQPRKQVPVALEEDESTKARRNWAKARMKMMAVNAFKASLAEFTEFNLD